MERNWPRYSITANAPFVKCASKRRHIKRPTFKRVILFGAKGLSAVIGIVSGGGSGYGGDATQCEDINPIYLTTDAEPKPAGLLPTDTFSRHFFHVHIMCPLCTGAVCISLGALVRQQERVSLIASDGTRAAPSPETHLTVVISPISNALRAKHHRVLSSGRRDNRVVRR